MKKSMLVLSLLSPFAADTQAQTSLTMYGLLDAGLVLERGCNVCNVTKLSSGVASGSRLGFRGSEDLGNGTAAVFVLEAGIRADTGQSDQGAALFGRQSFVGLKGRFGALTLGRHDTLEYLALTEVADPFKGGTAGSATNLVGYSAKRMDNTIEYATPDTHGFTAAAAYGFGEHAGNASADRAFGASVGYANGPLTLRVAHQNKSAAVAAQAGELATSAVARNTILAANVQLGAATAYAAWSVNKGAASSPFWNPDNPYGAAIPATASTDSRDILVGVAVPFGATTLLASYVRKNDRDAANRDADQIAVGATYAVSRRTDFYAAYARIKNRHGAAYTVGNASEAGAGSSALNIGMRHAF